MQIKQLTNQPFRDYPTVFVTPISLFVQTDNCGHTRHVERTLLDKDAVIQSAVYDSKRNLCQIRVLSKGGALVQSFDLKFDAGYEAFRGLKTLHVTLEDTPHQVHGRWRPAKLRTADGRIHYVHKPRTVTALNHKLTEWLLRELRTKDECHPDKISNKDAREYLDVWNDKQLSYFPEHMRRGTLARRIAFELFGSSRQKTNLHELVEAGFIPCLPQLEVSAKVLRRYGTKIEYQFVGLVQKGGKPNHTMNMQTARRVSRFTGESVSEEDLLSRLTGHFPYLDLGPLKVWAVGTATKVTKERT